MVYKHYITVDAAGRITDGFSNAIRQPQVGDICINEQGGYQFKLFPDGEVAPSLVDFGNYRGCHYYYFENEVICKSTAAELAAEFAEIEAAKPPATPTPIEELQSENKLLKAQVQAQTERNDFMEDCIAEMAAQVYNV